jgi:hypothetical protein
MLNDPVRTAQYTHSVSVIKTNQLMLYREIIAVCSQIHKNDINTLCGQNVELLNVKMVVHFVQQNSSGLAVQQKSSDLVFHTYRLHIDVTYSCHHNSGRFTVPIFVHSWRSCLAFITINHAAYILTKDTIHFLNYKLKHELKVINFSRRVAW